ncbi:hypothetical protein FJZ19_04535 [Candidatus Pacearchaeota archaeon]|nr:hypothetical protein [Candidatus Pacearchaeota archaeon]
MNRKAQGEIITTVLIILLVIAAVVIVWQAVKGSIGSSVQQIDPKLKCMDISFTIVTATSGNDTVWVTRESGGAGTTVDDLRVLVNGAVVSHATAVPIAELETKSYSATGLGVNDIVEVSAVMGSVVCPKTSSSKKAL